MRGRLAFPVLFPYSGEVTLALFFLKLQHPGSQYCPQSLVLLLGAGWDTCRDLWAGPGGVRVSGSLQRVIGDMVRVVEVKGMAESQQS